MVSNEIDLKNIHCTFHLLGGWPCFMEIKVLRLLIAKELGSVHCDPYCNRSQRIPTQTTWKHWARDKIDVLNKKIGRLRDMILLQTEKVVQKT